MPPGVSGILAGVAKRVASMDLRIYVKLQRRLRLCAASHARSNCKLVRQTQHRDYQLGSTFLMAHRFGPEAI